MTLVRLSMAAALLAAVTSAAPAGAADSSLRVSTGADWSSGSYGAVTKTRLLVAPVSARYSTGRLRLSATLPYIRIKGPGVAIGGGSGGVVVDPSKPQPVTTRKGLGDLNLGATYTLIDEERSGFGLDLGSKLKLPTGSTAKGLSTGKADVAASAEVSKTLGSVTPFASVGYRVPGKVAGLGLRNRVEASAGASMALGKVTAIASYDYAGKSSDNALGATHGLFGALAIPAGDKLSFTPYASKGLSKASPDVGAGLLVTLKAF